MIQDIKTILWKEWNEFFFKQSGRSKFRLIAAFGLIGILIPLHKGAAWFHSATFYTLAFIGPLLMLTSVVCDLFVGERERHTLETLLASRLPDKSILLGKLSSAISYSLCISLFLLVLNIITVNLKFYNGAIIICSAMQVLIIFGLNFLLALFGALLGAAISFKISTVKAAQQIVTISIILLIIVPPFLLPVNVQVFIIRNFSESKIKSLFLIVATLSVINFLLLMYMFSRYKRMKLLFD